MKKFSVKFNVDGKDFVLIKTERELMRLSNLKGVKIIHKKEIKRGKNENI